MNRFQLNIDCEGPLTQNDNAYELCQEYIPSGGAFFSIISKYDDFLADVVHKPGYKAGDTLKLVLPFLKAYDVTNEMMEKFSEKTLLLLPGTEIMLPSINSLLPSFIISTSYRPYLEALCNLTSFPMANCYCTDVDLDAYSVTNTEKEKLKELAQEISQMEMIQWPEEAQGIDDLEPSHQKTIKRLDEIFWHIIPSMGIGEIFDNVNPIGGVEKAKAVEDSVQRTGLELDKVIYAGDSITDSKALELVREAGGIALSYNGNRYAIRSAEYAIVSTNTCIIYGITALIVEMGKDAFKGLKVDSSGKLDLHALLERLEKLQINRKILNSIFDTAKRHEIDIYNIASSDFERLVRLSEKVRKEVRGHKVGELG